MAKVAGVVDINGSRYDSVTGEVIDSVKHIAKRQPVSADQVIDGFMKRKATPKKALASKNKAAPKKPRPARVVHSSAKSIHHRKDKSRTLVRSVVAKPKTRLKAASASLASITKPSKPSAEREARARSIEHHSKVSRFGLGSAAEKKEAVRQTQAVSVRPKAASVSAPSLVASASHQRLERILDEALMRADAHKQALRRTTPLSRFSKLPRWLSILMIVLLAILVGIFIIWRTVPAVAVKTASLRSHVNASVPGYTPAGFSLNKVQANPGSVSIKYQDKINPDTSYTVTQTKSSWDSSSLVNNTIGSSETVQTSQVSGTTVYIYGSSNNAAWVNNGSLFQIDNNAHLSSDQILKIAQGL